MSVRGFVPVVIVFACAVACGGGTPDPGSSPSPDPLGSGQRIAQVSDPTIMGHPQTCPSASPGSKEAGCSQVNVTGASTLWIDTFDETHDGKSRGTIYVEDVAAAGAPPAPYSGTSLFRPSFSPADLRLAPGDVLDLSGAYEELSGIPTTTVQFPCTPPMGGACSPTEPLDPKAMCCQQVLPQLSKPLGSFRFEFTPNAPRTIDLADLDDYTKGRQWLSMLVTVTDVTMYDALRDDGHGRVTGALSSATLMPDKTGNGPTLSNEMFDIPVSSIPMGTHFKSITGIVTYFYTFHIAPRTPSDLVQ